jgi:hypothetical protein
MTKIGDLCYEAQAARVLQNQSLRDQEGGHLGVEPAAPDGNICHQSNETKVYAQVTVKDLAKTCEEVTKQLKHCWGITGVPLAIVFHPKLIPKYQDHDPLFNYLS